MTFGVVAAGAATTEIFCTGATEATDLELMVCGAAATGVTGAVACTFGATGAAGVTFSGAAMAAAALCGLAEENAGVAGTSAGLLLPPRKLK